MTVKPTPYPHEAALEMIPWYVNGTLPAHERLKVVAHLDRCAACRREVAVQTELRRAIGTLEVDDRQTSRAWQEIDRRLDARRGRYPVAVAGLGLAASVALAVLGWSWLPVPSPGAPGFQTLTAPPSEEIGQATAMLRIRAAPGASPARWRAALDRAGLGAFTVPSATGLIHVPVPEGRAAAELAAQLMAEPSIAYVAGDF